MTDDQFRALWVNLVNKKYKEPENPLTEAERHFYAVNQLRGAVPRSGLLGYFENNTAADIRAAHAALPVLKLNDVLELLERAQAIALQGQPLPEGDELLELYSKELSEEAYGQAMDQLDQEMQPVEDAFSPLDERIFETLCRFAEEHGLA